MKESSPIRAIFGRWGLETRKSPVHVERHKMVIISAFVVAHEDRAQLSSRNSGLLAQGDAPARNIGSADNEGFFTGPWEQRVGGRGTKIGGDSRTNAPRSSLRD